MSTIDTRLTLGRAAGDLLDATMTVEGIGAALTALASDLDGLRNVTPVRAVRMLELLAGCCDTAVHRLGIVHDLIEAGDRQEGENETP